MLPPPLASVTAPFYANDAVRGCGVCFADTNISHVLVFLAPRSSPSTAGPSDATGPAPLIRQNVMSGPSPSTTDPAEASRPPPIILDIDSIMSFIKEAMPFQALRHSVRPGRALLHAVLMTASTTALISSPVRGR